MVKRYKCTESLIMHGMESGNFEAVMREAKDGEWVQLKTFTDEQAMLTARADRLKEHISNLQSRIRDLTDELASHNTY